MAAWGWRLPFLLGALVAALGLWMRQAMPETLPTDGEAPPPGNLGALGGAMLQRLQQVAARWRLVSFANVIFYLAFVFLEDFTGMRLGNSVATLMQTLGLPLVLLGGHLADRWGLVRVNRWGNLALLLVMPAGLLIGRQGTLVSLALALWLMMLPLMATWLLERQHWPWGTPLYALLYGLIALWAVQASRRQLALTSPGP